MSQSITESSYVKTVQTSTKALHRILVLLGQLMQIFGINNKLICCNMGATRSLWSISNITTWKERKIWKINIPVQLHNFIDKNFSPFQ